MGIPDQTSTSTPGQTPLGFPRPPSMDVSGYPPMNMPKIPLMGPPAQLQMNTPEQLQMNFVRQQPMNVPVQQPMNMPVQQLINAPGQVPMNFPRQAAPMNIPMQQPMNFPGQQSMNMPVQQPMNFPRQAPMNFPGQAPMNIPGQQPMNMPMQQPMNMPMQQSMNVPGQAPMNIPGQVPMGMPGPPSIDMPGPPTIMNEVKQNNKLDPEHLPSVVKVREDDKIEKSGFFLTGYPTAELPPLITTECTFQDQGNASPRFIQSTLYNVPTTSDILNVSHLPFAVTCRPFTKPMVNELTPPIAKNSDNGPVRCQRCRAYMCPFMKFTDGGRKFKCSFCDGLTSIPDDYFCHIDNFGRRVDMMDHPEFSLGSYEFVANESYCRNNVQPNAPAFIFMLDVSYNAIQNGLVDIFCKNFKNLLSQLPKNENQNKSTMKVGFVTYDNRLHFYNLSSKSKRPEMSIVSDVNDIFIPYVEGFLVDASEAEGNIEKILNEIPNIFGTSKVTEICFGPIIQAGLYALKTTDRSGKIFVFHTSLPTYEAPGKLVYRGNKNNSGIDKEDPATLSSNVDYYTNLGKECVKNGVSVDLFLFPNSFIDITSLSPLISISGGHLYKYQYFNASNEGELFLSDLQKSISRKIGFDAIMRVRTSYGLRPYSFYGHFLMQNSTDMEFGSIDSDKEVLIDIQYDDKLPKDSPCYIQAALLYTSVSGERRICIHNISLNTTNNYSEVYKKINNDTLITYLYKYGESIIKTKDKESMKEQITNICSHILATYRDKCTENSPIGQLILPECLKLLPVYYGSILKNDGLIGGSDLTVDDKAWLRHLIGGLTTNNIISFLYPRIIPVTGVCLENQNTELYIPSEVRGSYEYLKSNEAYLIKSGIQIFLWIGQEVNIEWIQSIFNVDDYTDINTSIYDIPEYDNSYSRGLRQLTKIIKNDVVCHSKVKIVLQNDPLESWMKRFLVEDRFSGQSYSYVDALCTLHREIRFILS
uniref:PDZ domain-containing protein n=1 Tax=Strongyloides stercoralis TaxID=6248 RepID=A0AAF5CSM4_STRER